MSHGRVCRLGRRPNQALVFRNRGYGWFFVGHCFKVTGNWTHFWAQGWLAFELTGSTVGVALGLTLQSGPMLLLGWLAGRLADRVPKRRILVGTLSTLAVSAAVKWSLTATGTMTPATLYGLMALNGVIYAVNAPARQTYPRDLVGPERYDAAIRINMAAELGAAFLAPFITAFIIQRVGLSACFAFDAATFIAMLGGLAIARPRRAEDHADGPSRTLELRAIDVLARDPRLWLAITITVLVTNLVATYRAVLPAIAAGVWHGGAGIYTWLAAAAALGAFAGAMVARRLRAASVLRLIVTVEVYGIALVICGLAPSMRVQCVALFAAGICDGLFLLSVAPLVQTATPGGFEGRVAVVLAAAQVPVGTLLAGWIADAYGAMTALTINSGAAVVIAAAARVLIALDHARTPVAGNGLQAGG